VRPRAHVAGLDQQDLLLVALRAEVRHVEALHHAGAGEVVDEVDLRNDRRRALDQHHLGGVAFEPPEPVDPVADAAGVDPLDLAEVDHRGARGDLVDEISELVVLVDDARQLHVADVVSVMDRGLELLTHCVSTM
jgi:hypothetical protein